MEFRVFLRDQCLVNPPPQPVTTAKPRIADGLLALVVAEVIGAVITGVANALKDASAEKTDTLTAEDFIDLYVANAQQALVANPALVSIVGVWFDPNPNSTPTDDNIARTLKKHGMVPNPALVGGVFEGLIRPSQDGTAFFLDTRHFSVRNFIGRRFRLKNERAYVVTLTMSTPNTASEGNTIAIGGINLGRCSRGDSLVPPAQPLDGYPRYWSNQMPWSKISEASKDSYERHVAAGQAAGRSYMPVALSLAVSETTDGSKFLLRLGELLGGLAEKASKEIAKQILPAEREKAAAEEAERVETIYEEELKAELEVRKARKAYTAGSVADKPALKVDLELAIRRLAWKTRLREAAGLPARPQVPPT